MTLSCYRPKQRMRNGPFPIRTFVYERPSAAVNLTAWRADLAADTHQVSAPLQNKHGNWQFIFDICQSHCEVNNKRSHRHLISTALNWHDFNHLCPNSNYPLILGGKRVYKTQIFLLTFTNNPQFLFFFLHGPQKYAFLSKANDKINTLH